MVLGRFTRLHEIRIMVEVGDRMREYKISIHATTLIGGIGGFLGGGVQISLFAPAIDGLLKTE